MLALHVAVLVAIFFLINKFNINSLFMFLWIMFNFLIAITSNISVHSLGNIDHRITRWIGKIPVKKYIKKVGGINIDTYHAVKNTGMETPADVLNQMKGDNFKYSMFFHFANEDDDDAIDYIPDVSDKKHISNMHTIRVYPDLKVALLSKVYVGDIEDPILKKEIIDRYFLDRFRQIEKLNGPSSIVIKKLQKYTINEIENI